MNVIALEKKISNQLSSTGFTPRQHKHTLSQTFRKKIVLGF